MNFTLTPSLTERFWAKVDRSGEHWLWMGAVSPNGYGTIGSGGKKSKTLYAHHVAYASQNGELPSGTVVRHKCDIKLCMRGKCLLPGTQLDNIQDRVDRNRTSSGLKHSRIMKKRAARGDRNGSRTKPESRPRGDAHYMRRNPGLRAGSKSPLAKLTERDIPEIRRLAATPGIKKKDVAAQYGIVPSAVTAIVNRTTWSHVL